MTTRNGFACLLAALSLACGVTAAAQDANITQPVADLERLLAAEPLVITHAEISRPKAKGDITLKADVAFGNAPPLRVKLRKAEPGADAFNNVPRYDLAAYELQKFYLDPAEYVVPPTALRMIPRADFAKYQPDVARTFSSAEQVLAVVQYWLSDITVVADVLDPVRFESDALYARHIGQLNILTYLIEHRDSNVGNFLLGKSPIGRPRLLDRSRRRLRVHRQRSWRGVEADPRQAFAGRCGRATARRHFAGARAAPGRARAMATRRRPVRPGRTRSQPVAGSRRAARGQGPADGTDEERDCRSESPARPPAAARRRRRDHRRGST